MLNPSIILQGQTPDFVGNFSRGVATANQENQVQRSNALSNVYQQDGAGILAGNQGSLNRLAQTGPEGMQQALGAQTSQQNMQISREKLQIAYAEAKQKAQEYAAGLSDDERKAQAQKIETGLAGAAFFYQNKDKDGYDNFLRQNGLDPASTPFEQFPAYAAQYKGALDALKSFAPDAPEWRPATPEEAAAQGAVAGQINIKTGKFDGQNPPSGMSITTNPDGTMSLQQGPGAGGSKPLTDAQSKSVAFAARAEGALSKFEPVANSLTSRTGRAADLDPTGLARGLQSDDFQVAKNSGDEFLQAILRKDTGAAITEQEQDLYGKTYLPQPGDGAAVLEAKRAARVRAVEALKAGMSVDELTRTENAIITSVKRSSQNQNATEIDGFKIEAIE